MGHSMTEGGRATTTLADGVLATVAPGGPGFVQQLGRVKSKGKRDLEMERRRSNASECSSG